MKYLNTTLTYYLFSTPGEAVLSFDMYNNSRAVLKYIFNILILNFHFMPSNASTEVNIGLFTLCLLDNLIYVTN